MDESLDQELGEIGFVGFIEGYAELVDEVLGLPQQE